MKAYLGVDMGTSGVKASVFDRDGGLIGEGYCRTRLHHPSPGRTEQRPEEMLEETVRAVARAVKTAGRTEIEALSVDGQMAGLMGVDRDGRATTPYDSWLDTRCQDQVRQMNRHQERVTALSGCAPGFFFGPKLLWWKENRPEIYEQTHKFIQPSAYAVLRLAGLDGTSAYMDYTYIHFSNLADNRVPAWSGELCGLFGVDPDKLPRIVAPTEIVGRLTDEFAARTGLRPGLPIAAGCGDTAAGLLGAGLVRPGEAVDTAGTASVLTFCSAEFRPDPGQTLLSGRSVIPGLWYSLAYINGGGLCIDWFAKEFGGPGQDREDSLEELSRKAARIPVGSNGLLFCPHFAGRNFPYQPNLRGSFSGLTWEHKKEHLFRAILEGITLEYRHYLNGFSRLFPELELGGIRMIGGGAKSDLFNGIKADCLEAPCHILPETEFSTLGSALVAATAVGRIKDLKAKVLEVTEIRRTILPDPDRAAAYRGLFREYDRYIQGLIGIFDRLKQPV